MIFDTIFVKARWERWCRWNCDLRVINARKKGIICRTESVAMTPKSRDHMPITSFWGVAAKCLVRHSGESLQNGQLELRRRNWYFAQETHKDTAVSVWACQAGFWKSTGTSCQLWSKPHCGIPWGLRNRTHWSARYTTYGRDWCGAARKSARLNCINLIHFRLTAGRLRGSSCIVIPGVVCDCYSSRQHSRPA